MLHQLDLQTETPLLIDEEFVKALDVFLRELRPTVLGEAAKEYEVTEKQIERFISGNKRGLGDKIWRYEKAGQAVEIEYEVSWDNGLTSKFFELGELFNSLTRESSSIESFSARIGAWGGHRANFAIGGFGYTAKFGMAGTRENIEKMRTFFWDLVKSNAPDYAFSYGVVFTRCLFALVFAMASSSALILGLRYLSEPDGTSFNDYIVFASAFWLGYILAAFASDTWKTAFPLVEYGFGRGSASNARRRALFVVITVLVIPSAIAAITIVASVS